MQSRFNSPVVLGVVLGVVLTQTTQLSTKPSITGWDIAIAVLTVCIAAVGALNNPTDSKNF